MFDQWLKLPAHFYLHLTALTLLTVGVALSNVLMSIGTIWIISNWLIELDFSQKWQRLKTKKSALVILVFFLLLILSLFWSQNTSYGIHDLRVKLPLLVIPLVMASSKPLETKYLKYLAFVFIGIISFTTIFNFIRFNFILDLTDDIRLMSTFISHVRLAILINLALFLAAYLVYKNEMNRILGVVLLCWFIFYIYFSQILNGYLLFVLLGILTVVSLVLSLENKRLKQLSFSVGMVITIVIGVFTVNLLKSIKSVPAVDFSQLELYTANGNPYFHDTTSNQVENGHYIWLYVAVDELENEWNNRSSIRYDSLDAKDQPMFGTLIRYLTSKGLRKDSIGVHSLTELEVQQIEHGQTSISTNQGLKSKLSSFLIEYEMYQNNGNPNGFSLLQRLEHLKAAKELVKTAGFFGYGVGDVEDVFKRQYREMGSLLAPENQHRSHNQILTVWVTLGIVGVCLFIAVLILPFFEIKRMHFWQGIIFVSLIFSCLFQDLIETQAGVTLFSLAFSLAAYPAKD
jgi:hypothetical protein